MRGILWGAINRAGKVIVCVGKTNVWGIELILIFVSMKPNRKSIRDSSWDYSSDGVYFITIRVRHSNLPLSAIRNNRAELTPVGEIVNKIWAMLPEQFEYARVDHSMIMPDHFHGIVLIRSTHGQSSGQRGGVCETSNPMLQNGLPRVLRWFKGRATFEIRKIDPTFTWQGRFYERRIRNQHALLTTREYIRLNPVRWKD